MTVAKNYLNEKEIDELNRIVSMYLDYAEDQARRRKVLYMRDWREKLDAFLEFNERHILKNPGRLEKAVADRLALNQYDKFSQRRIENEAAAEAFEFEKAVKKLPIPKSKKK